MPRSIAHRSYGTGLIVRCVERWFTSRSESAFCVLACLKERIDKRLLDAAHVWYPTSVADAWSATEFGVLGEENIAVLEVIRDSKIHFLQTRHEQGAAFMADVQGRLTGKASVCLATLGPGATNLLTGVADANMGIPAALARVQ